MTEIISLELEGCSRSTVFMMCGRATYSSCILSIPGRLLHQTFIPENSKSQRRPAALSVCTPATQRSDWSFITFSVNLCNFFKGPGNFQPFLALGPGARSTVVPRGDYVSNYC